MNLCIWVDPFECLQEYFETRLRRCTSKVENLMLVPVVCQGLVINLLFLVPLSLALTLEILVLINFLMNIGRHIQRRSHEAGPISIPFLLLLFALLSRDFAEVLVRSKLESLTRFLELDHDVKASELPHFSLPLFKLCLLLVVSCSVILRSLSNSSLGYTGVELLEVPLVSVDPNSLDVLKVKLKQVICVFSLLLELKSYLLLPGLLVI